MSYNVPENHHYTEEHEWTNHSDESVSVGITDFAQSSLGDIVFVELPEVGTEINKGDSFGVVESIKSVSDLYAPLSGTVTEVNSSLESEPDLLNKEPYQNWIIKIKLSNLSEVDSLLTKADYEKIQS